MTIQHRDTYADDLARQVDKLTNQRDSLLEACIDAEQQLTELIEADDLQDDDQHPLAGLRGQLRDAIAQAEGRK